MRKHDRAIVGSLIFGLVVIPQAGTQRAEQLLVVLAGLAGLILMERIAGNYKVPGAMAIAALLAWSVPALPWKLIGLRAAPGHDDGNWTLLETAEGMNSSVALFEV